MVTLLDNRFNSGTPVTEQELDISIHYTEREEWRFSLSPRRYVGNLEIKLDIHTDGYNRVFTHQVDVTPGKAGKETLADKRRLENTVIDFLLEDTEKVKPAIEARLDKERFSRAEHTILTRVAEVMELPRIMERYDDRKKDRMTLLLQPEQPVVRQQRKKTMSRSAVEKAVTRYETAAMYGIAVEASERLDYNLTEKTINQRVKALFDPDDNLQYKPLFSNGSIQRGSWANFVKGLLGDGFYNKLCNVEGDLDKFYLAVLDKTNELTADGELSPKLYRRAIREAAPFEGIVALLERERDAELELLTRLQCIMAKGNFPRALEHLKARLQFTGGYFTAVSAGILPFNCPYTTSDNITEFKAIVVRIKSDLVEYFSGNDNQLIVPTEERTVEKQGEHFIAVAPFPDDEEIAVGSYGQWDSHHRISFLDHPYQEPYLRFQFITGKGINCQFDPTRKRLKTLRKAVSIIDKYGKIPIAVERIVDDALGSSLLLVEDNSLKAAQQQIAAFHPYLDQQIAFTTSFYQGMKTRFERIYAEAKV